MPYKRSLAGGDTFSVTKKNARKTSQLGFFTASYSESVRIIENSFLQARQRKVHWGMTASPPKTHLKENPSRPRTWRQSASRRVAVRPLSQKSVFPSQV